MDRVLLLGLDGADWALLGPLAESGHLPCVARSIAAGAMGGLSGVLPRQAAPLWTTVATGVRPDRHGILLDEAFDEALGEWAPAASGARTTPALWKHACRGGKRCIVVNWAAVDPAEAVGGTCVTERFFRATSALGAPWPTPEGAAWPREAAPRLADLRIHPAELDAAEMEAFLPALRSTSLADDPRPIEVAAAIAETAGAHATFTELLANEPWDLAMLRLPILGRLSHFARFRAPALGGVAASDHARYGSVIDAACVLLDAMLARIVELAGPDATVLVVSPMGLRTGRDRAEDPRAAVAGPHWHRSIGMVLALGPGVRADQLVHGAGVLDIAPTTLALLGIPATTDMPGRVLAEAFASAPLDRRESPVERDRGAGGAAPPASWEASAAVRVLADLGYVTFTPEEHDRRRRTEARAEFIRAANLMDAGDSASAVAPLRRACELEPSDPRLRLWLAACLLASGEQAEARRIAAAEAGSGTLAAFGSLILGMAEVAAGNPQLAIEHLNAAERTAGDAAATGTMLHCQLARAHLALGHAEDAERAARQACAIDPECRQSRLALSAALLACARPQDAAAEALNAIGMQFRWPAAHLQLGIALMRVGRLEESINAIETSIAQGATPEAHEWMATVLSRVSWDMDVVASHRARARELRAGGAP